MSFIRCETDLYKAYRELLYYHIGKSSISHIPSVRHITDALITRSETNLDGSACNRSYRRAWLDSNKEISELILNCNKQSGIVRPIEKTNIFSNIFQNEQEECRNDIKDKGYYVFKKCLPRSLVQTIRNHLAFNYLHPEYRGLIDKSRFIDRDDAIYDNNKTIRFFYDSSKINTSAPLQYLAHDYALLVIIKELLGINPLVLIEGWLSVGKQNTELIDRSMAAQMFHFDLDAPNFLKLFIYLSDVTIESGAHEFFPKSHKPFNTQIDTSYFNSDGNSRVKVEALIPIYGQPKEMTFPAGTIILEDTRGFHRGMPLAYKSTRDIVSVLYRDHRLQTLFTP